MERALVAGVRTRTSIGHLEGKCLSLSSSQEKDAVYMTKGGETAYCLLESDWICVFPRRR